MPTGIGEWLIVLLVVLLIFGASRLPQIGEGLGKAVRGLKRGLHVDEDIDVTPKDKQVSEKSTAETVKSEAADAEIVEKKG